MIQFEFIFFNPTMFYKSSLVAFYNPCMTNDFVKSIKSRPLKICRQTKMTDVNTKQLCLSTQLSTS